VYSRRTFLTSAGAVVGAAALPARIWAFAGTESTAAGAQHGSPTVPLLLGVDYYPDQTPESLWEEDARMMADFGFTNVRVAEFAWSLMEPSEGKFDFAWLHRSVEILHKHGIGVILGTPSAAPPPWLTQKYPEVLMVNDEGMTVSPGGRRFTCPSNKTYRKLSLAIATEMSRSFADTPGVIGWQIDNEFTLQRWGRCYCKYCRAGFQEWVRGKYGSLDTVNAKWGTAFWSQIYTDFSQIPVPLPSNGDPNPGLALDYDRYQSYANASFSNEQLAVLRKNCPQHFVTTNNVGAPADTLNLHELYKDLDFVSHDNYPGFIEIYAPNFPSQVLPFIVGMGHDSMRGVKDGKPFLIMEEQSGKAGQRFFSAQPHPGQLRLWAFQAVAHGAMGVNYFRWDTADFGAEEYWHGILNHDRSKSPGFDEIKQVVKDMKSLGTDALHAPYSADSALIFDSDSDWALQIQPSQRDLTYMSHAISWYASISSMHTGVDVISPDSDLSRYKVVFAPVQYVLSEKQAARVRSYVEGGGTFVTSFRLGVKDESSQIVRTPLPGLLRDVMGATVKDYVPIYSEKVGVQFSGPLAGPEGTCALWADRLEPSSSATVLATYTAPYAGDAAITMNSFGKGKAVYIGADLDPMSLGRVLATVVAISGSKSAFEIPPGVELTTRKSGSTQWTYVLNHTSAAQTITLPGHFKNLLTGGTLESKASIDPYGVMILQPA
jgi:beta-galactosidase